MKAHLVYMCIGRDDPASKSIRYFPYLESWVAQQTKGYLFWNSVSQYAVLAAFLFPNKDNGNIHQECVQQAQ